MAKDSEQTPNRFEGFVVACAAPAEAVGLDGIEVCEIGVGKTAAAIGLMSALRAGDAQGVLLFGVAGAFPARHKTTTASLEPGDLCLVGEDALGDEGVLTPAGFQNLAELGLGDVGPFTLAAGLAREAAAHLGTEVVRAVTVSTCSGTESASLAMARQSGASIETMEGAAVALVCRELELPLVHLRAISNWTGDRERGAWDLGLAVRRVQRGVRSLLSH